MPFSLRILCAFHYVLGLLNALWTAFFAWVLGQSMWRLAPHPWASYNPWDKLFWITGPLLLVVGAAGVALNFQTPGWIADRQRLGTCRGVSLLNLLPLFSFFGIGLPVALYALWIYRRAKVRAWFEPTEDPLPELPLLAAAGSGRAAMAAGAVADSGATAARRRTTQLLAEVAR